MFEVGAGWQVGDVRALVAGLAGLEGADDAERIDLISELESLKGAASAAQARLAVAFADSQEAGQEASGVRAGDRGRGVAAQIALARRESPHRGSRHLGFARAMVHVMPATMAHLTAGRVSEWRATILCRETAALSVEDRQEVDRRLAEDLPSMGDAQVERVTGQASAAAVPIEVNLVMPAGTLLGASDEPAEMAGYGPISAETARALLAASADTEALVWLRRMLTSVDGAQLVGLESRRRLFPEGIERFLALRDKTAGRRGATPRSVTMTTSSVRDATG